MIVRTVEKDIKKLVEIAVATSVLTVESVAVLTLGFVAFL
jgi:hypothetical protein